MNIDIERLKRDRAYWNEVAPEGANYYDPTFRQFLQHSGLTGWHRWQPECWESCYNPGPCLEKKFIPSPEPATEWDGGLPPVGCECEYRPDPKIRDGWHHCVYLAHYDREHFVLVSETGNVDRMLDTLSPAFRFRPIRIKDEQQRDELADMISYRGILSDGEALELADIILAAGWKKPD